MFEEYLTQIKNIYNNKLLSAEETCYFIGRILEEYEKACPNCGSYSKEDCGCNEVRPTQRAVDLLEIAALQTESTPEVNPVGGADTTPPANH